MKRQPEVNLGVIRKNIILRIYHKLLFIYYCFVQNLTLNVCAVRKNIIYTIRL